VVEWGKIQNLGAVLGSPAGTGRTHWRAKEKVAAQGVRESYARRFTLVKEFGKDDEETEMGRI
jgi:hypothetical protein